MVMTFMCPCFLDGDDIHVSVFLDGDDIHVSVFSRWWW